MLRQRIPHPRKQLLFIVLSLADLALTGWLLSSSAGRVYEANPLARWWLARHGWLGLAAFKASVVILVIGLAGLIDRARPRAAGRILGFGCATLAVVVFYSAFLCRAAIVASRDEDAETLRSCAELNRQSAEERRQGNAYRALLAELASALRAGRCGLREAAERLAATERAKDPRLLRSLARLHAARTSRECLAAHVSFFAVVSAEKDPHTARRLARRLERDFLHTFGNPLPRSFITWLPAARTEDGEGGRNLDQHFSQSR